MTRTGHGNVTLLPIGLSEQLVTDGDAEGGVGLLDGDRRAGVSGSDVDLRARMGTLPLFRSGSPGTLVVSGGRGIRTHVGCNPEAVFKTAAIGH